jgi:hypothetical protein
MLCKQLTILPLAVWTNIVIYPTIYSLRNFEVIHILSSDGSMLYQYWWVFCGLASAPSRRIVELQYVGELN